MAKRFDATLNSLIDEHVGDWAAFLAARCGVPPGRAIALDTDLSSTLQADRLFQINGLVPAAVHLELESTSRLGIPEELLHYNVAARAVIKLPVHSVLVLLRPKANASDLTGYAEINGADGSPYHTFRYTVIRVWQESLSQLLGAGPGLAPLALLTNEAAADLPLAFDQFRDQLKVSGVPDIVERSLMGSTFVLCGLRYELAQIEELYRSLSMTLEDSTTYQLILEKGRKLGEAYGEARGETRGEVLGATRTSQAHVLLVGGQRFGVASPEVEETVRSITDKEHLERMMARVLAATDWSDLLATP
jgi:hypothetical protein